MLFAIVSPWLPLMSRVVSSLYLLYYHAQQQMKIGIIKLTSIKLAIDIKVTSDNAMVVMLSHPAIVERKDVLYVNNVFSVYFQCSCVF